MNAASLIDSLLAAALSGDLASIAALPGAGVHSRVVALASAMRGPLIEQVASMTTPDRVAFAKALAVYEGTVGGVGSVTALEPVLRLFVNDVQEGRGVLLWILEHTRSMGYYGHGAVDFIEPEAAERRRRAAGEEHDRRNYELAAPARARRAERATSNLFNAVRRGDTAAMHALLQKGASPTATMPDGTTLVRYAEATGREDIAEFLRRLSAPPSAA